jgi:hypothetical protein
MSRTVDGAVMKAMMRICAVGAAEREHFVDAGEQQRPGIAGGATVGRFGGWIGRWCQRCRRRCQGEGGDRSAQR